MKLISHSVLRWTSSGADGRIQHWNMLAGAATVCIGYGSCHGSSKASGISGMSTAYPTTSSAIWSTEFRERSLSVNSESWALMTLFSIAIPMYTSATLLIFSSMSLFSFCSWVTWLIRLSTCCCFLIRDLLADSLLDIILFLFLSSTPAYLGFPSDPELAGCFIESIYLSFAGSFS